jgi:hypothetical protein
MVTVGEAHLRRILSAYAANYNQVRTHLALEKDAPLRQAVQRSGAVAAIPILAGATSSIRPDMIFGNDIRAACEQSQKTIDPFMFRANHFRGQHPSCTGS